MSKSSIVLLALLLALGGCGAGYAWGHWAGKAAAVASQNAEMVKQLGQELESHRTLIDDANTASADLRVLLASQRTLDRQFSKEFRDALKGSSADRAGCVFDDGIVQQLGAARERAAHAAAGSGAATVPRAGASAGQRGG